MFERAQIKPRLAALARQGVWLGTSSWKYPGWLGQLYEEDRHVTRGKFSESRFNRLCLAEYAEVFQTVCVDAAYYKFPDQRYLEPMISQVPAEFQFAFKVTDEITLKRFTQLPRFGSRAGQANANFLNAELFADQFAAPFAPFRKNVGLFIFEFSKFYPADYPHGRDFLADLDRFLGALPPGWPYGIEIRNRNFLQPEYFALLARHGVAHIYNSWTGMPPVEEQMALPGSLTSPALTGARFLLKPGRKYQEAVDLFSPYDRVKDPFEAAQAAGAALIQAGMATARKVFIYVNNRLEGNALHTIAALLGRL